MFPKHKNKQASACNFVRGFSSFPTNKLIPRGATVGAEGSPFGKRCFVVFVLRHRNTEEAKERTYKGLHGFEEEANDPKGR